MMPDIVVDIGNSRIKWGWFDDAGAFQLLSVLPDSANDWQSRFRDVGKDGRLTWVVASVHPDRCARFERWVAGHRGDTMVKLEDRSRLPIRVNVREPKGVGMDRLLGAIAANARRRTGCAAITIDVGTAVTVNVVDPNGDFRGGAILPGFRLMSESLHENTAKLPRMMPTADIPAFPAETTDDAIVAGIEAAIVGGTISLCDKLSSAYGPPGNIDVFVTGGGSRPNQFIEAGWRIQHVPTLNLEGIRIAAEALP
jgi:type III pantothenate kinase